MQTLTGLPEFPDRPSSGHKGTFGQALIAAGSRGMSGAAVLAGLGALRSGTGLVRLAVPMGVERVVASYEPSYLVLGLPEDELGRTGGGAMSRLLKASESATAVAIGPVGVLVIRCRRWPLVCSRRWSVRLWSTPTD